MIKIALPGLALLASLAAPSCADTASEVEPSADEATEAHRALLEARIAACNDRDWDAWQALHRDDATRTAPELSEPLTSSAELRAAIEGLVETFPDYHLTLLDIFGTEDKAVARMRTNGTMLGSLQLADTTVPPTGRSFEQQWVAILRFDGDKIASIDEFYDNYGTLAQLGLDE